MSTGVPISVKNLYYALLQSDPTSGSPSYAAPVRIPGVIKITINPNASNETLFAEGGPYETASTIGQITVEMNITDLPLEVQAVLLGHTMQGAIMLRKAGDVPPWVAIGFQSPKSNGKNRYTWLAKGKFAIPEHGGETKTDKINFQTSTIQGSFVKRDCDDEWERHLDEDSTDFTADMATNWFNDPLGGSADATAPTLSSVVPTDGATGVAANTTIVWTFNEALQLSSINSDNFIVIKDSDGTTKAGVLSVNSGHTIVTFTPTGNFTAGAAYTAVVTTSVKNAYGLKIAAAQVCNFSIAS
jgi:phi13 family phage major tail protein